MNVPFLDLKRQFSNVRHMAEMHDAIFDVMVSGRYILGPVVEAFEKELAEYCNVKHAVGVASGTDALELALRAAPRMAEDWQQIRVPAFTFGATLSAVIAAGLRPILRDVDEVTFTIAKSVSEHCADMLVNGEGVGPIMGPTLPVHLYGQLAEPSKAQRIVIEDMAQGIGLPVTGDAACLSFFPTKNLGCMGDGGAVLTNDDEIAEKVRMLRAHGCKTKYHHEIVGTNSRLDAIQAAILRVNLKHLDGWIARRREIAERYTDGLKDVQGIICPVAVREHVWNQYTVRFPWEKSDIGFSMRDEVKTTLKGAGIDTMVYYPLPLHLQPAFAHLGYKEGDFPNAEQACHEVLSLHCNPYLTDEEQTYVIETLKDVMG